MNKINDFGTFLIIFYDSFEVPRTSKRTIQHNPWITSGITVAISHCVTSIIMLGLNKESKQVKKMRLIIGEVHACAIYVNIIQHIKEYRKTLEMVRKDARSNSIQENVM